MRPDNKSDSFSYHNKMSTTVDNKNAVKFQNCRRKLQDKFEQSQDSGDTTASSSSAKSVLSSISLDETRKVLRNGGERVSKALISFRTSLGSFSQVSFNCLLF